MARRQRAYHHGSLRAALIDASLTLVAREGADALTLRRVAEMAGVTHAAPYAHFRDKAELVAAVKAEGFRRLGVQIGEVLATPDRAPLERLKDFAATYIRFAVEQHTLFQMMFRERLDPVIPGGDYIQLGRASFHALTAVMAEHVEGSGRRPEEAALMSWSFVHGLTALWADGPLRHVIGESASLESLTAELVPKFLLLLAGPQAHAAPPRGVPI